MNDLDHMEKKIRASVNVAKDKGVSSHDIIERLDRVREDAKNKGKIPRPHKE